ncbi:hypothetical protein JOD82_000140 [Paenibacillus sp. 1182]|nr:hypothetical protein [Paenibacillus sp. 1182]
MLGLCRKKAKKEQLMASPVKGIFCYKGGHTLNSLDIEWYKTCSKPEESKCLKKSNTFTRTTAIS